MGSITIRVSKQAQQEIKRIAAEDKVSMQTVIDQALESYRRKRLLTRTNLAYARLRKNSTAWREFKAEQAPWDKTVGDGVKDA